RGQHAALLRRRHRQRRVLAIQQLQAFVDVGQPEALAHLLGQAHAIIAYLHAQCAVALRGGDADFARPAGAFQPVLDGVFHQRDQHRRREGVGAGHVVGVDAEAQALAHADLHDGQVAARQRQLAFQRR
ncbi:conserved hypothetical protein, partial [Ricinus communis]